MNLDDYILGYLLALSMSIVSAISVLPFLLSIHATPTFIMLSCGSILSLTLNIYWQDFIKIKNTLITLKHSLLLFLSNLFTGHLSPLISPNLIHSFFIIIGCVYTSLPNITTYFQLAKIVPAVKHGLPYPVMVCLTIVYTIGLVGTYLQDLPTINRYTQMTLNSEHITYITGQIATCIALMYIQRQFHQSRIFLTLGSFTILSLICGTTTAVNYIISYQIIQSIIRTIPPIKNFRINTFYKAITESTAVISMLYLSFCDGLFFCNQIAQQLVQDPSETETPGTTIYTIMNLFSTYAKNGFKYSAQKAIDITTLTNMVIGYLSTQQSIRNLNTPPIEKHDPTPKCGTIYIFTLNILIISIASTWLRYSSPALFSQVITWLYRSDIFTIPNHITSAIVFTGMHIPFSKQTTRQQKSALLPGDHLISSPMHP